MKINELVLETWEQLSEPERFATATQVAARLGSSWRFAGIELHELGNQRHPIAFYRYDGARFALIPGATVTLGYDRAHPFQPTPEQQASWDETRKGYDSPPLTDFLDHWLTPLRQVTIAPFLLEAEARLYDISPEIMENGIPTKYMTPFKRADAIAAMVPPDFRLPTSDEWEYACSAGARTLFRWGDDTPSIPMPLPTDARPTWDLHLRPNAFGVTIGTFPYNLEYCVELDILRGGDGGTALHAGMGTFAEWLTLASALIERPYAYMFSIYIRRVWPLFQEEISGR